MPNWVYTYLVITGAEKDLREFMEKAKTPYVTNYTGGFIEKKDGTKEYDETLVRESVIEQPISFWNFKKPTNLEAYFSSATGENPEGYETWTVEERLAYFLQHQSDGWYDWNIRNWGTKWEATDVELEEYLNYGYIVYRFNTAWSPPEGAFQAMTEQHLNLHFRFECEEEQGWGVEYESFNGNLSLVREWDIPESHADYRDRDNIDGCICNWEDDQSEWYDDCPREMEKN